MLPAIHAVLLPLALGQTTSNYATACTNAYGTACPLPFYYNDTMQYSAVELTSGSGVLQCPSEVDFYTRVPSNTSTWSTATCRALQCATAYTEVTGVAAGTPCVFPFREGGVLRHSCVSDDPWGTPAFCATATDNSSNYGYMQWGYCNCWDASGTPPTLPPPTNPPTVAPTTVAPTTRAPTTAWPTYPPVAGAPPPTTPPPTPPPPERVPAPPPPSPGSSDKSTQRRSTGGNGAVVGILSILCASGLFAFLFVSHKNGNLKKWVDQANEYANENWHTDLAPKNFKYTALFSKGSGEERSNLKSTSKADGYGATAASSANSRRINAPAAGKSSFWGEVDDVDWDALEAAATSLRTCRVKKNTGEKLGLRLLNYSGPNFAGARIIMVNPGSPGEAAGILEGDNIVEINGHPIINMWHEEVINLLKESGNEFDIVLCRSTRS